MSASLKVEASNLHRKDHCCAMLQALAARLLGLFFSSVPHGVESKRRSRMTMVKARSTPARVRFTLCLAMLALLMFNLTVGEHIVAAGQSTLRSLGGDQPSIADFREGQTLVVFAHQDDVLASNLKVCSRGLSGSTSIRRAHQELSAAAEI